MLMPKDPQVIKFIEDSLAFYPADAIDFTIEENRDYYNEYAAKFRRPRPEGINCLDSIVQAADGYKIPVRHYQPSQKSPYKDIAVLFTHGGGMMLGGLDSHDDSCAELCDLTGIQVFATDYRLAPEHVYPTQLNDVATVYQSLLSQGLKVIVVGDSSGGNLSAALCHWAKRESVPMPLGQVLIYPGFFSDKSMPSYRENADAAMLTTKECHYHAKFYCGVGIEPPKDDPCFSPVIRSADFSGLPPAFLFSADIDPIRDDCKLYAELLRPHAFVKWVNEPELVHGYLRARHISDRANNSFIEICKSVVFLIEQTSI